MKMKLIFYSLCIFTVVLAVVDKVSSQELPSAALFNTEKFSGETFSVQTWIDRPNLSSVVQEFFPPDIGTRQCLVGIWSSYEEENYAHGPYWKPQLYASGCSLFYHEFKVRSIRFLGMEGESRLVMFAGRNRTLEMTDTITDRPSVASFTSLVLIGDVPVQLFLQTYYGGFSYCFRPDEDEAFAEIKDIYYDIGLNPGDVKSLRFGCSAEAKDLKIASVKQDRLRADNPDVSVREFY